MQRGEAGRCLPTRQTSHDEVRREDATQEWNNFTAPMAQRYPGLKPWATFEHRYAMRGGQMRLAGGTRTEFTYMTDVRAVFEASRCDAEADAPTRRAWVEFAYTTDVVRDMGNGKTRRGKPFNVTVG